jgi:hypothetical protein
MVAALKAELRSPSLEGALQSAQADAPESGETRVSQDQHFQLLGRCAGLSSSRETRDALRREFESLTHQLADDQREAAEFHWQNGLAQAATGGPSGRDPAVLDADEFARTLAEGFARTWRQWMDLATDSARRDAPELSLSSGTTPSRRALTEMLIMLNAVAPAANNLAADLATATTPEEIEAAVGSRDAEACWAAFRDAVKVNNLHDPRELSSRFASQIVAQATEMLRSVDHAKQREPTQ